MYLRIFCTDIFYTILFIKFIFDITNCFHLTNGFVSLNQFIKLRFNCIYIFIFKIQYITKFGGCLLSGCRPIFGRFFSRQTIANYTEQIKMLKLTESVIRAQVKLKSITENRKFKKVAINNSHIKRKKITGYM